jgi:glycosyl-4,4'-diaponeurosporenoate acyltransferase
VLIELPVVWIVILNVAGWLVIQLGLSWAFTKMPVDWFAPPSACAWEHGGRFYERVFGIKCWKELLPDAARWFTGGFAKGTLGSRKSEYIGRFVQETWRGELCHWLALACAPVFFLWNPWWADLIIVAYAIAANLPCILVQRYNRLRLSRLMARRSNP